MANTTAIFTLPTNFSADQRASKYNDPQKQFKRSSSTSTALTELSSVCASSAYSVGGTSDDDEELDNFLNAFEEAICPDDQVVPVDDTLTKLLGYEQGYKEIFGEANVALAEKFAEWAVTPEECANAIVALCSGLFDSMSGQVVTLDKGATYVDNMFTLGSRLFSAPAGEEANRG